MMKLRPRLGNWIFLFQMCGGTRAWINHWNPAGRRFICLFLQATNRIEALPQIFSASRLESSTIPATACFTALQLSIPRPQPHDISPAAAKTRQPLDRSINSGCFFPFCFYLPASPYCLSFLFSYFGSPSFSCSCSRLRPSFATSGPCFSSCRLRLDRSSPLSVGLGGFSFVIRLPSLSLSFSLSCA